MKRATRSLLVALPILVAPHIAHAGTTVITHGYAINSTLPPGWALTMAEAILATRGARVTLIEGVAIGAGARLTLGSAASSMTRFTSSRSIEFSQVSAYLPGHAVDPPGKARCPRQGLPP